MSERTIQIYRVTHVAEHLVEDDGIYDDEVDMLRDVVEAARQGLLEFERTDADFVAMMFDEENVLKIRALEVEGLDRLPVKAIDLPDPIPPPAPSRKLDDAPRPRPARRPARGPRRST